MVTLVYSLEPSRRAWRTTPVQLRVHTPYADPPRRCVWPSHLAVEEGMEHRERVGWLVARDLKKTVRWEGQAVIMLAG